MREYRRSVPAPTGLALDLIGVPEGAPLVVEIRLESVTEGVLVTGIATAFSDMRKSILAKGIGCNSTN